MKLENNFQSFLPIRLCLGASKNNAMILVLMFLLLMVTHEE